MNSNTSAPVDTTTPMTNYIWNEDTKSWKIATNEEIDVEIENIKKEVEQSRKNKKTCV